MITNEDRPSFPTIQGIDINSVGRVIPLSRYIIAGSLDNLDDDSIILSSQLARSIGAVLGSKVGVYTPLAMEKATNDNEVLLPSALTVVGIFEIGHQQLDSSTVIVTLRKMQDLYGLGHAVHGVYVKIAPGLDADLAAGRINEALRADEGRTLPRGQALQARSWAEVEQDFLWVLQLEKNIMTVILLFVVIVAAFLTMSLLLVLVLKKTREIGLLGALGAGRRAIALCFCLQGVLHRGRRDCGRSRPGIHLSAFPKRPRPPCHAVHREPGRPRAVLSVQRDAVPYRRPGPRLHHCRRDSPFDAGRDHSRGDGRPFETRGGPSQ